MRIKKILVGITLCFVLLSANIFALYTSDANDYNFMTNSDGSNTITLTKYTGTGVINYLPDEIEVTQINPNTNKKEVIKRYYPTRILNTAFPDKSKIRVSLDISDNYIYVEQGTFKESQGFQRLNIGTGIKTIPAECFASCSSLDTVTGMKNVTIIEDGAFSDCRKLSNITLNSEIESIGDRAFYNCLVAKISNLPNSITYIGNEAFYGCMKTSLTTLPSNIEHIGNKAFFGCKFNETLVLPNSLQDIGQEAFIGSGIKYVKIMTQDIPQIYDNSFEKDVIFIFQEGTKANGNYIEKGYGNYESYEVLYGDVDGNGFVNATDAAFVLDMYKNSTSPDNELDFLKIDLDGNNVINATDAAMILDIYKNS